MLRLTGHTLNVFRSRPLPPCALSTRLPAYHVSRRIFTPHTLTRLLSTRTQYTSQGARDREAVGVFTPRAAALLVVVGAGLLYYFDWEKKRVHEEKEKARASATYGRPDVGGPFELVTQHGTPFTEKDLLGTYSLVYFGFTNCPDICPDELDKMSAVVENVEKSLPASEPLRFVKPIFVSVDPARDSVEQIRRYALDFHPRLIALTGTYSAVKSVCKAYRVYFSSPPPKEGEEPSADYLVDHSIYFYLMDPEGHFVQAFGKINTAEDVTERVLTEVTRWNKGERAGERWEWKEREPTKNVGDEEEKKGEK